MLMKKQDLSTPEKQDSRVVLKFPAKAGSDETGRTSID